MATKPVIIITGATSGIGKASSFVFAQAGYRLVLAGRRAEKGQAVADEIRKQGHEAIFKQTDVTNDEDLDALVATTKASYGRLDVLFNNAGVESILSLVDPVSCCPAQSLPDGSRSIGLPSAGVSLTGVMSL